MNSFYDPIIEQIENLESFTNLIDWFVNYEGKTPIDKVLEAKIIEIIKNPDYKVINEKSVFKNLNKDNLCEFFLGFFSKLDNSSKIFQYVIGKPNKYNSLNNIFNLVRNFRGKFNLILSTESKRLAIDEMFNINIKILKDFIDIFELQSLLFDPDTTNNYFISNRINSMIEDNKVKLDNLIKYIDILFEFNQNFTTELNYKKLFELALADKKLFNIVKKLLLYYPFETANILKYYLTIDETKQACDLVKEDNLRKYINQDIYNQIILQSKCKSLRFHLKRYINYEIDIQYLLELFIDDNDLTTYLCNMLCKKNFYAECFHILKSVDFDLNSIKLDDENQKELMNYLSQFLPRKNVNKNYYYTYTKENLQLFCTVNELSIKVDDYFGPHDEQKYLKIDISSKNIKFIDKIEDVRRYFRLFNDSKYIGLDLEWKPNMCSLETSKGVSLMQLASLNYVCIIDMLALNANEEFINLFNEHFKDKVLIGFGYKNDVKNIKGDLKKFLIEAQSIDLADIYLLIHKKNSPSLNELCKLYLGKELDKYPQLSNWDLRPLHLKQIHYAALDAFILLKLYDKMSIYTNKNI